MDDAVRKINLIPIKPEESPQNRIVMALFRRLSLWALVIFIVSGIAIGGTYYFMKVRYDQLLSTKQDLSRIVEQNAVKEGLLASVKQRTALITKILGVQLPVGKVFDLLVTVVPPSQITRVTVDEKNNVAVSIHASSIDDVLSITDALIKQATANRVRAPQLVSLAFGRTGGIDIGLSFVAVL
jgi:hypothetical protein